MAPACEIGPILPWPCASVAPRPQRRYVAAIGFGRLLPDAMKAARPPGLSTAKDSAPRRRRRCRNGVAAFYDLA